MAYFIPALIFLSAVVITLSLMLFIKIAQAVAENSHRVRLCVCVCVILRNAWLVSGRRQRGPKSWGATSNLPKEEDVPHSWTQNSQYDWHMLMNVVSGILEHSVTKAKELWSLSLTHNYKYTDWKQEMLTLVRPNMARERIRGRGLVPLSFGLGCCPSM